MTAAELLDQVKSRPDNELPEFIEQISNEIQLYFLSAARERGDSPILQKIFIDLMGRARNERLTRTVPFQGFLTQLALYFKEIDEYDNVRACESILIEHVTKKRLSAYIFQRRYANWMNHITFFERYIEILSASISDEFEDHINDALADLFKYRNETIATLKEQNQLAIAFKFGALFDDPNLASQYPLLRYYRENLESLTAPVTILPYLNKIYKPSIFTAELFNREFIDWVKRHPNTIWHEVLAGYDKEVIRSEILGYGQTDFDSGYQDLFGEDVVKLYCFMNMRKHFYSSYSLFERSSIINDYYRSDGRIKFIDIGCGPATSGIALVDYLHQVTRTNVLFDYYGIDCYKTMLAQAKSMMANDIYHASSQKEYLLDLSTIDKGWLKNASCMIFNACYLFASPTLDIDRLNADINRLRKYHPFTPTFFLYQNTTDPKKNIKYQRFKSDLLIKKMEYSENTRIFYSNRRDGLYKPSEEIVYFEVLSL